MADLPRIKIVAFRDGSDGRVALFFPPQESLDTVARQLPGSVWSEERGSWSVPNNPESLRNLFRAFWGKAYIDKEEFFASRGRKGVSLELIPEREVRKPGVERLPQLIPEVSRKVDEFEKWMKQMRYSESTIRTYSNGVRSFFSFHPEKPVEKLTNRDLEDFNNGYILKNRYSASYQNQVINAVKLFFQKMVKREMIPEEIERPRKEIHLPNVLSKEEVKSILDAPVNLKHRAMLSLIYACGLRRSELINLKPADVESTRGLLVIRQSKGNKDRVVPVSVKVVEMLREYYKAYRPKEWLFEGQIRGEQYSSTSLQEVLKKSVLKAGIRKPVTLHWLRHSYATHLLESGTDLRYIQELLGHKSSRTTEIYTHVSQKSIQHIRSPFDDL